MLNGNNHHLGISMNAFRAIVLALVYNHGRIRSHAKESVDEFLPFFHPSRHNVVTTFIISHFANIQTHFPS